MQPQAWKPQPRSFVRPYLKLGEKCCGQFSASFRKVRQGQPNPAIPCLELQLPPAVKMTVRNPATLDGPQLPEAKSVPATPYLRNLQPAVLSSRVKCLRAGRFD